VTSERLREMLNSEPFHKFVIHLADGRDLQVHHREFVALSASGRTAIVLQPDDSMNIVDLLLVTDLELLREGKGRKNGDGRSKRKP
jgi:hypothetical protein